ncbi:hypothetical protein [Sinosporangium siamense]|nr:hypothetical protein [Sinosporangium siamense]
MRTTVSGPSPQMLTNHNAPAHPTPHTPFGRAALGAGVTPRPRSLDLGEFADWPGLERIVLNLHRWIADAQGGQVDYGQAFDDVIACNHGPMHTSV